MKPALVWISKQLLYWYTGCCIAFPFALVAAVIINHYRPDTTLPWPTSTFWSVVLHIFATYGQWSVGRLAWVKLKPEWFYANPTAQTW